MRLFTCYRSVSGNKLFHSHCYCMFFQVSSLQRWHVGKQNSKRVPFLYKHFLIYIVCTQLRTDREKTQMCVSGAGNQLDGRTRSKTHADSFSLESEWMLVRPGCLCLMIHSNKLVQQWCFWCQECHYHNSKKISLYSSISLALTSYSYVMCLCAISVVVCRNVSAVVTL